VTLARSSGRFGVRVALVALVALCAVVPLQAGATSTPNHHQVEALFVIDHNGKRPHSDRELQPYSTRFEKILGGCFVGPDALTMHAINLADQASAVGARHVTALMILESIAIRVTWIDRRGCQYVYNLAEARRENGDT